MTAPPPPSSSIGPSALRVPTPPSAAPTGSTSSSGAVPSSLSTLSPPRATRPSLFARSPHSHRCVKAFPREQLWAWKGDRGGGSGSGSSEAGSPRPLSETKPDAIETVLRESALSSLLAGPRVATPSGGSSVMGRSRLPLSPVAPHVHLHLHLHLHHHNQHLSAPTTPQLTLVSAGATSSNSGSSSSNGSDSSHSLLQRSASKRRLAKKESQSSLRSSSRHLVSPASSASGREAEGWRAYKVAHRTNRLMAKTKKLITALHSSSASSRKLPVTGKDDADADNIASGETDAKIEQDASNDGVIIEEKRATPRQPLTRQQLFERDVCTDEVSDGDSLEDQSVELRRSSGTLTDPHQNKNNDDTAALVGSDAFWQVYKSSDKSTRKGSARGQYITRCEDKSLLVLPVLDLQRPSRYNATTKTLRFDNYYFGDDRAEAFGGALHLLPVSVNNLSMKNVGLTSPGSCAIVNGLKLHELQHLSFAENRIGPKGALAIFNGLRDPHVNLQTLDLGDNQLGDQAVLVLMQCLVERCTLEHLDLRKNSIFHSAKAVGELLRLATPLKSLNLAWNNIRGEPAQHLAKCIVENTTLTSLNLSDNSLGNSGNAEAELGACLAHNTSLRILDVSSNHIQGKAVLVYVNALQLNTTLEKLIIRANPIGNLGTEAVLRAVASGAIAKCEVDIGDCNVEIQDAIHQTRIYGGGMYNLNLSEKADAVLLKELLSLCWTNKAEISDAAWNGAPYTFNRKDEKTFVTTFPSNGVLQLTVQPNYDRREDLITYTGLARIEKLLQRSFGAGRDGDEAAKLLCIRLLAEEYSFNVDHANALLALFQTHTSQVEKATAAAVLIPQISGAKPASTRSSMRDDTYDCASMEIPPEFFEDKDKDGKIDVCGDICMVIGLKGLSDLEQAHVEQRVGKWISFNVANPTGRYRLNMSNPIDRRILMRILETNRTETKLRQHYKLVDTSQHGLAQQPLQGGFRNMRVNHVPVVMNASWQFPRVGILEFDFVQTKRPFAVCTALSDAAFEQFLREFKQLDVAADVKLIGLRSISSCYYFNCSHVQRLMEHFGTFERDAETGSLLRAEVLIILFSRIVDEWNFCEPLALLDLATKHHLLDRLGLLHCFHPLQVAESYGPLRLTQFDHRQLIVVLVKLATSGEIELTSVVLNNETVVLPVEWKAWTAEDKVPALGVLSCSMRALQGMQSEAQLPPTSMRKKMIQTVLLKLENRTLEQIF